ncbi:MAG: PQQ-binding-like beta-propeller repeat protein [Chitinophagaceae bacterium]
MFRGNVTHSGIQSSADLVYDTRAWQFYTGAAVRSTPLISNSMIFFGSSKGDFFAIDKKNGQVKWKYYTGQAINSSAASQNQKIFFADNKQTLYCLNQLTGKKIWDFSMGQKIDYPWRFDYYYSSPVLYDDKLVVGSDDGYLYNLDQKDGKVNWKFKTKGLVRSTAAVFNGMVLFGDTEGIFYAVDRETGKEKWTFKVRGEPMNLEEYGFDRKAILAAPVISQDKIIFGARDGFLYCLDANGKQLWVVDHQVSWIVSTVAVKDTFVVTGTSDGRFVQAVNLNTGKEIWKFRPNSLFWSSPLIVNDKVYAGGFDGVLYCLDLEAGQRISQFSTGDKIMSSPVWDDDKIYVGSDDGSLYAVTGHPDQRFAKENLQRFVYYEPDTKGYFRNGSDLRIKNYLVNSGYRTIVQDTLIAIFSQPSATNTVIVLASSYLPAAVLDRGNHSLLRKFLDTGGRIILPGTNSMIYVVDEKTKQPVAFNIPRVDSVLGINYGPNDTRAMGGQFPCFATDKGKQFGLPDFWNASIFLKPEQVDLVLGKNENGQVSAFVKNFAKGGSFVQLYIHPDLPQNLDAIIKLAEWKLE